MGPFGRVGPFGARLNMSATKAKATAAKGAAKPASEAAAAPSEEPPSKKARYQEEDEKKVHSAQVQLTKVAQGKISKYGSDGQEQAKEGLKIWATLTKEDKLDFAKKVEESKASKSFSWVRTYVETMRSQKRVAQGVVENYMTRIFSFTCACTTCVLSALLL